VLRNRWTHLSGIYEMNLGSNLSQRMYVYEFVYVATSVRFTISFMEWLLLGRLATKNVCFFWGINFTGTHRRNIFTVGETASCSIDT
jgi:hypothetical protein